MPTASNGLGDAGAADCTALSKAPYAQATDPTASQDATNTSLLDGSVAEAARAAAPAAGGVPTPSGGGGGPAAAAPLSGEMPSPPHRDARERELLLAYGELGDARDVSVQHLKSCHLNNKALPSGEEKQGLLLAYGEPGDARDMSKQFTVLVASTAPGRQQSVMTPARFPLVSVVLSAFHRPRAVQQPLQPVEYAPLQTRCQPARVTAAGA